VAVYLIAAALLFDWQVFSHTFRLALLLLGVAGLIAAIFRLTGSLGWSLAAIYLGLATVTLLPHGLRPAIGSLVTLAGVSGFIVWGIREQRNRILLCGALSAVSVVTILAISRNYTWLNMQDRLVSGAVHQDTLFHSSIAAMIKSYGINSTGINGLVEIHYHVFSHRIIAALSSMSGVPVLDTYGVAPWIFFAPLLLLAFTISALELRKTFNVEATAIAWCLVCCLLTFMPFLFRKWALWDSYFVSESYLMSLGLLGAAVPLLVKKETHVGDAFLLILLTALSSMTKGSVGVVLAALCCVRFATFCRKDLLSLVSAVGPLCAVVASSFYVAASAGQGSGMSVEPLHFVKTWSFWGSNLGKPHEPSGNLFALYATRFWAVASFLLFHFSLSWFALVAAVRSFRYHTFSQPEFVLNAASLALGICAAFMLNAGGGGTYYFTNVAMFVALPFVVCRVLDARRVASLSPLLAAFTTIVLVCLVAVNPIIAKTGGALTLDSKQADDKRKFLGVLERVRATDPVQHTIYEATWELLAGNPVPRVSAKPFVYPAVSEKSWTGIVDEAKSKTGEYAYYGYEDYLTQDGRLKAVPSTHKNFVRVYLQ